MPRDDWARMRRKQRGQQALLSGEYERVEKAPVVRKRKPHRRKPSSGRYFIRQGTMGLYAVRGYGGPGWKQLRTSRPLTFSRLFKQTEKAFIFEKDGYLLCVSKKLVSVEPAGQEPVPEHASAETHYRWTHPVSGEVHWIPHDVDMSGWESEVCPFDIQ